MEKLGIADQELLKELKEEYKVLKEREAQLVKTGSKVTGMLQMALEGTKMRIDELEEKSGGKTS